MSGGGLVPLDPVAAAYGLRLERLDGSGGAASARGVLVAAAALSPVLGPAVAAATGVGPAAARPTDGDPDGPARLGWVGPDGAITATGQRLRRDLGASPVDWTLTAQDSTGERCARLLVGATRAVVIEEHLTRPWQRRDRQVDQMVRVAVIERSGLPVFLASWVGLGPAWSVETDVAVPANLVEARLRDAGVPAPTDADVALRAVWANPWLRWSLACPHWGVHLRGLCVGDRGQYLLRPTQDEATVRFVAQPATLLWGRLIEACQPPGSAEQDWGTGIGPVA